MSYQWHVYVVQLDPVVGSEQAGARPVVVVSRDEINQVLPVVNVIPVSSYRSERQRVFPNEVELPAGTGGLAVRSVALAFQIRTIDKSRLGRQVGQIDDPTVRQRIRAALRFQMELG